MRCPIILQVVLLLSAGSALGALHLDGTGGYSIQSRYQYFAFEPVHVGTPWLTYDPINNVAASLRLSVDIGKGTYRFGVAGGFMRRFELHTHVRTLTGKKNEKVGEMLSIPIIGFIEGYRNRYFYEFGVGPFITRHNYIRSDLPEFSTTSLFGFLFGGGYLHPIVSGIHLLVKGELLVNAPVFLVDYLDVKLKKEIHDSRYTEYNVNEFQSIIYNATISLGVQYEFGKNIAVPSGNPLSLWSRTGKE